MQLTITLLTTAVIILTVVVVAVLAVLIMVLLKVRKVANQVGIVTNSIATASSYLHPLTWVKTIKSLIKQRR